VVYRGGLENRWGESSRGFESLPLRHTSTKCLIASSAWEHLLSLTVFQMGSYLSHMSTAILSIDDPLSLHQAIMPGAKVGMLGKIAKLLQVKEEELALLCGLSRSTFHRRRSDRKNLSAAETDALFRYSELFKHAVDVLEDEAEAREWLRSPQYGLAGQIPLDLARSTPGFNEVQKLLTRIDHGVYA
jgi:putative toxin-antitoxin system antitoxin component (TIGR02293 family)